MTIKSTTSFKPKKGRPTAAQTEAIEKSILSASKNLFLRDGFDVVTMENVAADAGVSKGTLYSRYPSKETLFHAVIRSCVAEWAVKEEKLDLNPSANIGDRLRYHGLIIARSLFDPEVSAVSRLVVSSSERFPENGKEMYEVGYLYIVNFIAKEIRLAAKRDGVPVKDASGVARHLVSAIAGYHFQESFKGKLTQKEVERFALKAVGFLMAARSLW